MDDGESHCKTHQGEQLKFFCRPCDQLICRDCKITKHELHETEDVSTVAKEAREKISFRHSHYETAVHIVQRQLTEANKGLSLFEKSAEEAKASVASRTVRLVERVRRAGDQILRDIEEVAIIERNQQKAVIEGLESKLIDLERMRHVTKNTLQSQSDYVLVKSARTQESLNQDSCSAFKLLHSEEKYRKEVALTASYESVKIVDIECFLGKPVLAQICQTSAEMAILQEFRCVDNPGSCRVTAMHLKATTMSLIYLDMRDADFYTVVFDVRTKSVLMNRKLTSERTMLKVATIDSGSLLLYPVLLGSGGERILTFDTSKDTVDENVCIFSLKKSKKTGMFNVYKKTSLNKPWKKLFKIRVENPVAICADSSIQNFAVIQSPCDPAKCNGSVACFKEGCPEAEAVFRPKVEKFRPSDVCFHVVNSREVLLVCDEANNAIYTVDLAPENVLENGYVNSYGELLTGCPWLLTPTALAIDDLRVLWIGCKDGAILKCLPVEQMHFDSNYVAPYDYPVMDDNYHSTERKVPVQGRKHNRYTPWPTSNFKKETKICPGEECSPNKEQTLTMKGHYASKCLPSIGEAAEKITEESDADKNYSALPGQSSECATPLKTSLKSQHSSVVTTHEESQYFPHPRRPQVLACYQNFPLSHSDNDPAIPPSPTCFGKDQTEIYINPANPLWSQTAECQQAVSFSQGEKDTGLCEVGQEALSPQPTAPTEEDNPYEEIWAESPEVDGGTDCSCVSQVSRQAENDYAESMSRQPQQEEPREENAPCDKRQHVQVVFTTEKEPAVLHSSTLRQDFSPRVNSEMESCPQVKKCGPSTAQTEFQSSAETGLQPPAKTGEIKGEKEEEGRISSKPDRKTPIPAVREKSPVGAVAKQRFPLPIFSTNWQDSYRVSNRGAMIAIDSVTLYIPPGALGENDSLDISTTLCEDSDIVRRRLNLPETEKIASPLAEFGQDFQFRKPIEIMLPHSLPENFDLGLVCVYCIRHGSDESVVVTRVRCAEVQSVVYTTVSFEETGSFQMIQGGFLCVTIDHMSGYVCTYTDSISGETVPTSMSCPVNSSFKLCSFSGESVPASLSCIPTEVNSKQQTAQIHILPRDSLDVTEADTGLRMKIHEHGDTLRGLLTLDCRKLEAFGKILSLPDIEDDRPTRNTTEEAYKMALVDRLLAIDPENKLPLLVSLVSGNWPQQAVPTMCSTQQTAAEMMLQTSFFSLADGRLTTIPASVAEVCNRTAGLSSLDSGADLTSIPHSNSSTTKHRCSSYKRNIEITSGSSIKSLSCQNTRKEEILENVLQNTDETSSLASEDSCDPLKTTSTSSAASIHDPKMQSAALCCKCRHCHESRAHVRRMLERLPEKLSKTLSQTLTEFLQATH